MMNLLIILVSGILVQNLVLARFLGLCPFIGVSKRLDTVYGMGMAVIFVSTLAAALTWPIHHYLLEPMGLGYLRTVAFILVIASLVQLVEMVVQRVSPTLHAALGIFLPLLTTNCAVLGVALLSVQNDYTFVEAVVYGLAGGVGWLLATALFAGIRERLEGPQVPRSLQGLPIAFVAAGLLSLAFMGFQGLFRGLM